VEAGVAQQPVMDLGGLVRGVVVQDQMQVQVFGHRGVDELEEAEEFLGRCRRYGWAITDPLATSKAANRLVVPLRT
jgi:hypothetical protein